jgi:formylglycine-generating enzyme required for sulfatase activity
MIYVPPGRFLYGTEEDEETRKLVTHQPEHPIAIGAFLISRLEVTNEEYLTFWKTLPPDGQKLRRPGSIRVTKEGAIVFRLSDPPLAEGEPYCLPNRPCVPWEKLPLQLVSGNGAAAYAAWLAATGRLPHARLCTDREWERAARGADDRRFPAGNAEPAPDEACTLSTYGGDKKRAGACLGGSYPASRSPFGVDDMTGNVFEWTAGTSDIGKPIMESSRGGAWSEFGISLATTTRMIQERSTWSLAAGLRVCADAPAVE